MQKHPMKFFLRFCLVFTSLLSYTGILHWILWINNKFENVGLLQLTTKVWPILVYFINEALGNIQLSSLSCYLVLILVADLHNISKICKIPRWYHDVQNCSLFYCTFSFYNSLPALCYPVAEDMNCFKTRLFDQLSVMILLL